MKAFLSSARRRSYTAILLAVVFFVALNYSAGQLLTGVRLDLTEDKRFTLNPVTEALLADLQEPLTVRLYVSASLTDNNPAYAQHAQRVTEMLERFAQLSNGRLTLQLYDPAPFSPEEDLALADGLQGYALSGQGTDPVYLGMAARNTTDDLQVVPFFTLERANYLEYDLAQLVQALAQPDKPEIGMIGRLSLLGDQASNFVPQVIYSVLQQSYRIRQLDGANGEIPPELSVVMVTQPDGLEPAALYALDQFVLRGGRLLVLADPFSEQKAVLAMAQYQPPLPVDFSGFAPLLEQWGATLDSDVVAADRLAARRVMARSAGRDIVTDYIAWLALPTQAFHADDPLMARMQLLNFNSAGVLRPAPGRESNFTALAATSNEGMQLSTTALATMPDPVQLLAAYQPGGERLTVIARLVGPMESAFAAPPDSLKGSSSYDALLANHRQQTDKGQVLVIADSDFVLDAAWLAPGSEGDSPMPVANNGEFLLNALDEASGTAGLAALRGGGLIDRPFVVMQELQRDAEQKFRAQEQALTDRIAAAEQEIGAIEENAEGGVVLTAEQNTTLETLRLDLLSARRELRDVQRQLRESLEAVTTQVQLINVAAMPLVVALLGLSVALVRRWRAGRVGGRA